MQTITVDFSQLTPEVSTRYGGEAGEHQAVQLRVIPEEAMQEDEDIAFYYLLFKVEGGLVSSRTYNVGEEIVCALWDQLTARRNVVFQLIGTNGEESIIAKTPVINLYLGESLEGTVIGIDDNRDSLIAMIGAFNERLSGDETKIALYEIMKNSHESKEYGQKIWEMYKRGDALAMSISGNRVVFISYVTDGSRNIYIYTVRKDTETNAPKFYTYSVPLDSSTVTQLSYTGYAMSSAEKEKLDAISTGTIAEGDTGYVTGDSVYDALQLKQDTLTAGENITIENNVISSTGGASVQSDYAQTDSDAPDYIKNKPDLSVYAESSDLSAVATSGDYTDLSNTPDLSVYAESSDLATVATSGAYSDLSGTPSLANVATSGDYDDLINKPTIPAAQIQSDYGQTNSSAVDYIKNKPDLSVYAQSSSLATVATSGSYADLSNTPTIPSEGQIASGNTGYVTGGDAYTALSGKQDTLTAGQNITISNNVISASGGGFVAQSTAPSDTSLLWIDTDDDTGSTPMPRLPVAFQEVEYIESTGTQYIDTGVGLFKSILTIDGFATDPTVFSPHGATEPNYGAVQFAFYDTNDNFRVYVGSGLYYNHDHDCSQRHTYTADDRKAAYILDGDVVEQYSPLTTSGFYSMYLFGRHSSTYGDRLGCFRLYGAKIGGYVDNTGTMAFLQRDFVPCYRKADGVIGMYDLVTDTFYTNSGTGTFTKGADV